MNNANEDRVMNRNSSANEDGLIGDVQQHYNGSCEADPIENAEDDNLLCLDKSENNSVDIPYDVALISNLSDGHNCHDEQMGASCNSVCPVLGQVHLLTPRYSTWAVEMYLVLLCISTFGMMPLYSQYRYKMVVESLNINISTDQLNVSLCSTNKSSPEYILQNIVQSKTALWDIYISCFTFIPSLFVSLILGGVSDRYGRKFSLIIPIIGQLLSSWVYSAIIYFDLPLPFLFFASIDSFFGGFYAALMGCFACMADLHKDKARGFRMTMLDMIIQVVGATISLGTGFYIKSQGFLGLSLVSSIFYVLCIFFAVFVVPETNQAVLRARQKVVGGSETAQSGSIDDVCRRPKVLSVVLSDMSRGYLLFVTSDCGRHWRLCALLLSYVVGELVGGSLVLTLFEMDSPLCWDSVMIGWYSTIKLSICCLMTLLTVHFLLHLLQPETLIIIGKISAISESIYLAFVFSAVMMYLSPILGCISYFYLPMYRASMSRLIKPNEQGALFALMGCIGSLSFSIGGIIANKIYQCSLDFFSGFVFLVVAFFQAISLLILVIYLVLDRRRGAG